MTEPRAITDDDPAMAELLRAAAAVQARAHAPYSRFKVGAAVRAGGKTFAGANVENASYGLSCCAERTAVFAAVLAGAHPVDMVAVYTDAAPPSSPCGACRQVLNEFAPDLSILSLGVDGTEQRWTMTDLLPAPFEFRPPVET